MKIDSNLWEALLNLKEKKTHPNLIGWLYNGETFDAFFDIDNAINKGLALLLKTQAIGNTVNLTSKFLAVNIPFEELNLYVSKSIDHSTLVILQNYWPLSILNHLNIDLPYVFIHSATSLDGYLATSSGHSQWIGNPENLIHAHRLRALLDAVLVGGNTVLNDNPSLNVRHVEGKNPKRLILSNNCNNFSNLKQIEDCETYLLRHSKYHFDNTDAIFNKVIYFKGNSKKDKLTDLLQKCKEAHQIKSILVEGGSTTLSAFIETKLAKIVQFHFSTMLFGSGIKAVTLPKVKLVSETVKLKNMLYTPIGDAFMITANLV